MKKHFKFLAAAALAGPIFFGSLTAETIDIDLAKVLELAGTNNTELILQIEQAQQAKLDKNIAWYNWIPDLRIGGQYSKQEGLLQNTDGTTVQVERDSFSRGLGFTGPGSGLASSPGLSLEIDLADAFFDTRVASRKLTAAREAESATSAQVMLKAAELYYNLLESRRMVELLEANNSFAGELAKVTNAFAQEGQGLLSDSQQASVYYIMLQSSLESAHLQYAQAGAQLARFLALDESADLRLRESSIVPLELYESLPAISRLINSALDERPELRQAEALREAAEEQHNMQMWSPLFPKVAAYYSDGDFEGGNEIDSDSADRQGYSVAVFWELEGLGFKNYSNSGKKESALRQARTIESQIRADVAAEVKLAHDAVKHSKNQLNLLSKAVEQARQAYELTRERVFENKGMPMEAMQSMRMLEDAEKMMLRTVARYNLAQLQLLTVSGNSINSQVIR